MSHNLGRVISNRWMEELTENSNNCDLSNPTSICTGDPRNRNRMTHTLFTSLGMTHTVWVILHESFIKVIMYNCHVYLLNKSIKKIEMSNDESYHCLVILCVGWSRIIIHVISSEFDTMSHNKVMYDSYFLCEVTWPKRKIDEKLFHWSEQNSPLRRRLQLILEWTRLD